MLFLLALTLPYSQQAVWLFSAITPIPKELRTRLDSTQLYRLMLVELKVSLSERSLLPAKRANAKFGQKIELISRHFGSRFLLPVLLFGYFYVFFFLRGKYEQTEQISQTCMPVFVNIGPSGIYVDSKLVHCAKKRLFFGHLPDCSISVSNSRRGAIIIIRLPNTYNQRCISSELREMYLKHSLSCSITFIINIF